MARRWNCEQAKTQAIVRKVVETLNLQHEKTVITSVARERENVDREGIRDCSWKSLRALHNHGENASMHDDLDADKTTL